MASVFPKNNLLLSVEIFINHVTSHQFELAAKAYSIMTPFAQQTAMETYHGLRAMCPTLQLPKHLPGVCDAN